MILANTKVVILAIPMLLTRHWRGVVRTLWRAVLHFRQAHLLTARRRKKEAGLRERVIIFLFDFSSQYPGNPIILHSGMALSLQHREPLLRTYLRKEERMSSALPSAAAFAPAADGALEMESLIEETIDNGNSNGSHHHHHSNGSANNNRGQQPYHSPRDSYTKWATVASLLIMILGGWVFQQTNNSSSHPDPNTLETDIEALPSAVRSSGDADDKHETIISNNNNNKPSKAVIHTITTDLPHPDEPAGYKHPDSYFSDTYIRRARSDRRSGTPYAAELQQLWGAWTFVDPLSEQKQRQKQRLTPEEWDVLAAQYPNRDVPFQEIPETAWQRDAIYLEKFLQQGVALTERALKSILAEYGHYNITQEQIDPNNSYFETAMQDAKPDDNAYMFNLTWLGPGVSYNWKHPPSNGGAATPEFLALLKRQLLHAVMTQGTYKKVVCVYTLHCIVSNCAARVKEKVCVDEDRIVL